MYFVYSNVKYNGRIILALVVSMLFYLGFLWQKYDGCVWYTVVGVLVALLTLLARYFLEYNSDIRFGESSIIYCL